MGLTVLDLEVANPAKPRVTEKIEFLIDSGAIYSVVPTPILKKLGIKPFAHEEFRLADGSKIIRRKGGALFRYQDKAGMADVIPTPAHDSGRPPSQSKTTVEAVIPQAVLNVIVRGP